MRVLHVAESFGGGTQSAILRYVAATPDITHTAVVRSRSDSRTHQSLDGLKVQEIEASLPRFLFAARSAIRDQKPDVVHLHSSKAGLVRLVAPRRSRIVYTPHCYAFERTDLNRAQRGSVRVLERLLGKRRQVVLAVGPRESDLALEIASSPVVMVPNAVDIGPGDFPQRRREPAATIKVVTCGRVAPQKDPRLFAEVAKQLIDQGYAFEWIGGGDESLAQILRNADVEVTGWVTRDEVLQRLAASDVYLHTAAWESNPISLLEAATLGLPVIARSIPSIESLGFYTTQASPRSISRAVRRLGADSSFRASVCQTGRRIVEDHDAERQASNLCRAYRAAARL